MFLAGGSHGPLKFVLGNNRPTPESYIRFRQNLSRRAASTHRHNASYVHLAIPDKHTVCRKAYPYQISFSLLESYLNSVSRISAGAYVVAPLTELEQQWDAVYYKQDTHLTPWGSIIVVKEVLESLKRLGKRHHALPTDNEVNYVIGKISVADRSWSGDLGSKMDPVVAGLRYSIQDDHSTHRFSNKLAGGNNGIVDMYINPLMTNTRERLLLFGDSFGRDIASCLSRFFFQVMFLRTPFYHSEIVAQVKPTIVITQHVERYLSDVRPDEDRPSFFMYPYMKNTDYAPTSEFSKAFSALLSFDRRPYQSFLESLGITTP